MKHFVVKELKQRFENRADKRNKGHWYRDARRHAKRLATTYDLPLNTVVGIISALSPNNKWERNLVDAENLIKLGDEAMVCTYGVQKKKALTILNQSLGDKAIKKVLNGVKTKNFFTNILYAYTNGPVTVDMWAIRAAGYREETATAKDKLMIAEAYKEVASELGLRNHEFQAIIWSDIRDNK